MKILFNIILIFNFFIYSKNAAATGYAAKMDTSQDIENFVSALGRANYSSNAKRFTFEYDGRKWFVAENHLNFLTNKEASKKETHDIQEITATKETIEGKIVRCFYTATCGYYYSENSDDTFSYDFYITTVLKN